MGVSGQHLIVVASVVAFTLAFSIWFTNSTRRVVVDSLDTSSHQQTLPDWVYKYRLENFFNVTTQNGWQQPTNRTHDNSSLFFEPTIVPPIYTVAGPLPASISIVDWKRATPNANLKPHLDPRTCDEPHDWGLIISPFPNDPAYPPGATSREWDQFCRPEHYRPPDQSTPVLRIEQGYVEGGPGYEPRHPNVYGLVFNHEAALQLERWVMDAGSWFQPPQVPRWSKDREIESYACLASLTGTAYPDGFGHFPLQIFPRIVRLLALSPPDCPLLISAILSTSVQKGLTFLRDIGLLDNRRKVIGQHSSALYYADVMYFSDGPQISSPNLLLLNQLVTSALGGPWLPTTVVYLQRAPGPRALDSENEQALLRIMQQEFGQTVHVFKPSANLTEDALLFGKAGLVVGPHGAGFTNILFCPQSAVLLEIGYPGFFPDYYMRLASALGLAYHNIVGEGLYASTLNVSLDEFRIVFAAALADTRLPRPPPGGINEM